MWQEGRIRADGFSCAVQDVERIFGNLTELHELSVKLLGDLDDCIEMSGQIGGESSVPQAGLIFEDLAEVSITELLCERVCNYVCSYSVTLTNPNPSHLMCIKRNENSCPLFKMQSH